MQREERKRCSFFGHRTIYDMDEKMFEVLIAQIEQLIESGYNEFLFGGYGDFDSFCHKAVNDFKHKYPHIKTVYVQAYYKPQDYQLQRIRNQYDKIAYPEIEDKLKRFAITYRNQKIIDNSDFCIFYVNRSNGGAAQALSYAKRKKKPFVNLTE